MSSTIDDVDDFRASNLAQLAEQFRDRPLVRLAERRLARVRARDSAAARRKLARELRDHEPGAIDEPSEIRFRDGVDYLLQYYSVLEIASLFDLVPDEFDTQFRDHAQWQLNQPAVVKYYEDHYPLLLPRMFRERLDGVRRKIGVSGAPSIFARFLNVSAKINEDSEVETLLWFLDDGIWGEDDIDSVVEVTGDPDTFVRLLASNQRDRLTMAIGGLRTFLGFCAEFDSLLASLTDDPLAQSAFWHFHGYWFDHLRSQLGKQVRAAVRGLASWSPTIEGESARDAAGRRTTADLQRSVERLTSGVYGRPLRAFALGRFRSV